MLPLAVSLSTNVPVPGGGGGEGGGGEGEGGEEGGDGEGGGCEGGPLVSWACAARAKKQHQSQHHMDMEWKEGIVTKKCYISKASCEQEGNVHNGA